MRGFFRPALAAMILVAVLFTFPLASLAGEALKWKGVSHISRVETMEIMDAGNHLMGIYEHTGVALFADGEAGSFVDRGSFDMYSPEGTHKGYGEIRFGDGSTILFAYQGEEYRREGSDLPFVKGKGNFMRGTGRYKGISGTLSYDGGYVTAWDEKAGAVGDSVVEYEADYSLKK